MDLKLFLTTPGFRLEFILMKIRAGMTKRQRCLKFVSPAPYQVRGKLQPESSPGVLNRQIFKPMVHILLWISSFNIALYEMCQ